jgi:tetratricopeptide (TPR) repeat protein
LPKVAEGYHQEGLALLAQQHFGKAINNYTRAIALDPHNEAAHYDLGDAYERVFDYARAIPEYQRAIEINGGYDEAYINLGRLYILNAKDYGRALALVSKAFRNDGTVAGQASSMKYAALKNRGWAFWGLNQQELAEEDLRQALKARDGAEANALLARLLEGQGRKREAQAHWHKATIPAPGDVIDSSLYWLAVRNVTRS